MAPINCYKCPGCEFNHRSEFIINFHQNTCFTGYLANHGIFEEKCVIENFIKILTNYNYFNNYFPSKATKKEKIKNVEKYFIYIDAKKINDRDEFVKYVSNLTYIELKIAYQISEMYNYFTKLTEEYILNNF